jgi:hypothetical protein
MESDLVTLEDLKSISEIILENSIKNGKGIR